MRHFDPDDLPDLDPTPPAEDDDDGEPCDCDRCTGADYNPLDQPEPIGGWEGNRP